MKKSFTEVMTLSFIIVLVFWILTLVDFNIYRSKIRKDLLDHKVIQYDSQSGKLIYISDKSPFNY